MCSSQLHSHSILCFIGLFSLPSFQSDIESLTVLFILSTEWQKYLYRSLEALNLPITFLEEKVCMNLIGSVLAYENASLMNVIIINFARATLNNIF